MHSNIFLRSALSVALLGSGGAFALAPSGAEIGVGVGQSSSLAMAADGRHGVSYTSGGNVLLQRYSASGAANGSAVHVYSAPSRSELLTDVAAGPGGKMVVTWWEVGSGDRVRVQAVNADGSLIGSGDIVAEGATRPAVAYRADGSFLVAYEQGLDVFVQRYAASGSRLGSPINVSNNGEIDQEADLAADAAGNFSVVWSGVRGGSYLALLRQFDASGNPLSGETAATDYFHEQVGASQPHIAMRADGRFVVLWDEGGKPGSTPADAADRGSGETIMRLFYANGAPVRESFLISDHTNTSRSPSVAMDAQGDFVVATETRPFPTDGSGPGGDGGASSGIELRRFNVNGEQRGDKLRVNTTTAGNQYYPAIAVSPQGNMMVSWDDVAAGNVKLQRFVTDNLTSRLAISTSAGTTSSVPVPGGAAGTYSFDAQLCNNASDYTLLSGITSRTLQLTNGNVLLNRMRDGSPTAGTVGSEIDVSIPQGNPGLPPDLLFPGYCVTQHYQIGLANKNRFSFRIDLLGDAGLPN